jgi:hypothetical protein
MDFWNWRNDFTLYFPSTKKQNRHFNGKALRRPILGGTLHMPWSICGNDSQLDWNFS